MKKTYTFANGKTAELEVNSAVAELLADFQREDENEARKSRWRKEVSIEAMYEETGWEPPDTTVDIEADYIAQEEKDTLLAAIAGLTEKQRRVVQLYYYEEKSIPAIAKELGVKKQSVHECLEWAIKKLKKYF